jgi:hypothetical protein
MIPNDHISIFIVECYPFSLSNTSGGEYARVYVDFKVSTVYVLYSSFEVPKSAIFSILNPFYNSLIKMLAGFKSL